MRRKLHKNGKKPKIERILTTQRHMEWFPPILAEFIPEWTRGGFFFEKKPLFKWTHLTGEPHIYIYIYIYIYIW